MLGVQTSDVPGNLEHNLSVPTGVFYSPWVSGSHGGFVEHTRPGLQGRPSAFACIPNSPEDSYPF